jgi:hypothetical protein
MAGDKCDGCVTHVCVRDQGCPVPVVHLGSGAMSRPDNHDADYPQPVVTTTTREPLSAVVARVRRDAIGKAWDADIARILDALAKWQAFGEAADKQLYDFQGVCVRQGWTVELMALRLVFGLLDEARGA